ncbi:MAG: RNA-binding domain-containing protein [Methanosarcina sp.]|jgi:predicted HTH transcriptional regulator
MSILRLLAAPESRTLEFKEKMPSALAIAKTVCAFSNGAGGSIIIGIRDRDKTLIGIDELEISDVEEQAANITYEMLEPIPSFNTTIYNIEGKLLLKVEVYPGRLKPYHLKEKGEMEGTFVRIGSTNRKADPEIIEELRRQRMNISFDETVVQEAGIEELEPENLAFYFRMREKVRGIPENEINSNFLKKKRFALQLNGSIYPTVAGVLLFSTEPDIYLPGALIRCARFKDNEMDEFLDQRIISGPLFSQVEEAIAFFKRNIRRGAKIEGLYRKEAYEYPEKAIKEALVNAVCHRDYSRKGADIKFAIFDDRIEITSPGQLPSSITLDDLGKGVSEHRNKVIGRTFSELGLIEGFGTGVFRMRKYCKEWGISDPEFREDSGFFKTIFYKKRIEERKLIGQNLIELDEDEKEVLTYIEKKGKASTKELESILGKSKSTVKRKIKKLIENKYLIWQGKSLRDPSGYYELRKEE